jgi:putative addiction module component (TIGR02574 family)
MEVTFDQMTALERIRYVQALWEQIAQRPDEVPVTQAMQAELDRRLAEHRDGLGGTVDWAEVKAGRLPDP